MPEHPNKGGSCRPAQAAAVASALPRAIERMRVRAIRKLSQNGRTPLGYQQSPPPLERAAAGMHSGTALQLLPLLVSRHRAGCTTRVLWNPDAPHAGRSASVYALMVSASLGSLRHIASAVTRVRRRRAGNRWNFHWKACHTKQCKLSEQTSINTLELHMYSVTMHRCIASRVWAPLVTYRRSRGSGGPL